jgi:glycosyltransferase involved in cell wall biosynthesis
VSAPSLELLVPYWGERGYLRQTVESVLAQTDPDWRLTILDDGYPDPWAGPYVESLEDPRVRYQRQENGGVVAAFARCVELAEADVVVIPGCDDLLLPGYVATVRAALRDHPEVDLVQPGVQVIDAAGRPAEGLADAVKQRLIRPRGDGPRVLGGERLATGLLHGDWLYWPSLAFRREVLARTPFRQQFPIVLDLALVLDLLLAGSRMLLLPDVCFAYRRHGSSASSVGLLDGDRFAGEREFFRLAARLTRAHGWPRAARAARLHVTSRLHAVSLLPTAVRRRPAAVATLLRHALG